MDEEGQKYKVAYCSDRYTENRDKQFCTESLPSLEASGVFSGVLLHFHAWTYEGQDPEFDYSLGCGEFSGSSYTSDLKTDSPVATLPGSCRDRVNALTGWSGVSIL